MPAPGYIADSQASSIAVAEHLDAHNNLVDRYVDRQQVTLTNHEQVLIARINKLDDLAIDVPPIIKM